MSDAKPDPTGQDLLELSTEIVSAYLTHNSVSVTDLPRLIAEVHSALNRLSSSQPPMVESTPSAPAVSVGRSVTPEHLVCLEDGQKFKSLKRHLRVHHGLSPDAYRLKYKLPATYPMVAPNYSIKRSTMAKQFGLGRKAPVVSARSDGSKTKRPVTKS